VHDSRGYPLLAPGATKQFLLLAALVALAVGLAAPGDARAPSPRETSIFYYPWYGNPTWDGSYLHWAQDGHVPPFDLATSFYPLRGPYSSTDPQVVAAQMRDIAGAGIHEVVSSWWGWGSLEDDRLPMIIRMATSRGLNVAVQIEPYADRSIETVSADIDHLRELGITRFYIYHPFEIAVANWAAFLTSLTGVQVLAQTGNVSLAQAAHFAGLYTYDIVTFGPTTFSTICARAHQVGLLCAPSVGPGYDALRADGDTHDRPRDSGATYDAMWRAAIRAGADRVTITSYNEWHEGTQIEPAATPLSRSPSGMHGGASTPVTAPYLSYQGAYGLHGKAAARAYLERTKYWTSIYRSGDQQPSTSTARTSVAPTASRKRVLPSEGARMDAADRGRRHGHPPKQLAFAYEAD
jgi:glycosyl hydrolase family 99